MSKLVGAIVIILLIVGVYWMFTQEDSQVQDPNNQEANAVENNESVEETGEVKEFNITGGNYYYSQEEIRVNQGDRVRITFSSEEGFHDWVIDEFDAATEQVNPEDGEVTVEFVADQAGEFEYYCSVGQHRELGQVGTLIVE